LHCKTYNLPVVESEVRVFIVPTLTSESGGTVERGDAKLKFEI
jgi:hypothetical protein